ncbi:bifunctional phosphopantothenoylcysteine decarboxylase/phosphopantothenate--cysteine ligase CoaBC [Collinsella tanakaei]|uniref:Coenzyme A biosynthesis bifunctional protein CoaBC n=1 Tax=Collinsella tanakaei YIT 12063 TaxID=742742 RepID=G1WFX8_9ACTN|nr:bifunctional phosphopantothenoylcysteine decarboxylase/phosphopantothenate--cysteine ligase CoaBC [Collinsella tanakaei]EGX67920.1 phosphopantothenoylcysteine decarboxylase/phosphopantothenate-cysteine ligase [Collinsella tanakaei YIT 12063]
MGAALLRSDGRQACALVCVTGCIAAYKSCEIVRLLQKAGVRVKVLMSEHATHFVGPTTFRALTHETVAVGLIDDPQDPIHHISLAQEPDVVLVAPATANVMAKMAHGIADDLLSTTLLATNRPIVIAPAMNTGMWEAAATQENLSTLIARGCEIVRPACGRLACGDVGSGKLASVEDIAQRTLEALGRTIAGDASGNLAQECAGLLQGKHVVVTAGGTQEAIDPVRYIGNRSSGKFGYAIASAAHAMGARVVLVSGPTNLPCPDSVHRIDVVSADDMFQAVDAAFDGADILVCAAAVADYTPVRKADHKLKKANERLDCIELVETRDILASMSARKGDRVVVGFAAETDNLIEYASSKLASKGCDAIVANDVSRSDSTFGSDTDKVTWITADGAEELPCMPKNEAAFEILRRAALLYR